MDTEKKQFSMSLLVRLLLGILVVASIIIFATGMMKYNELRQEEKELEEILNNLVELREELEESLGSGEEVEKILSDYALYQEMLNSGTAEGETLLEIEARLAELRALLQDSKYKDYIAGIARDRLGLYFPEEEIIYNGGN